MVEAWLAVFNWIMLTTWSPQDTIRDPQVILPIIGLLPLYRQYTILLNDRLVARSEEHGLHSPIRAGFRPRQSPIRNHHLFAFRHFIDRAILQHRPLFVSFVDLQTAYDTGSMACSGLD